MFSHHGTRVCGGLLLLGLLALSAGCGGSRERATVKGKVSFAGKTLTAGNVMFHGKDNASGSSPIDKDGNYTIHDAPLGPVQVTVMVPKLPPGGLKTLKSGPAAKSLKKTEESVDPEGSGKRIPIMGEMPANVVPIPEKYGNTDSSGLTFTVEKGEQTHDIILKP